MLSDAVVIQFSAVSAGDNVLTVHLSTSGIAMVPECLRSSPQESHQVSHYNCAFIRFERVSE